MNFKRFLVIFGIVCLAAIIVLSWGCQNQPTAPQTIKGGVDGGKLRAELVMRLRGRSTDGQGKVRLIVGGKNCSEWTLGTGMGDHSVSLWSSRGNIRVEFFNDASGRDVQVDYLSVGGDTRQAESQNTNTAVWQNGSCGGSRSEWMHCNGYIDFGDTGGGGSTTTTTTSGGGGWTTTTTSGGGGQRLRNRATGLYLDGMGRTNNGDACGQYSSSSSSNQLWSLVSAGSGYYYVQNQATGMRLDSYGQTSNGSACRQYRNTTSQNAQWRLESAGSGYNYLTNRSTGMRLDGMGRTNNGADVGLWNNTTHNNAQWQLTGGGGGSTTTTTSGYTTTTTTSGNSNYGEVTRSGSTYTAKVGGSTVYTGSRMFDAVNACINNMSSGTVSIKNSGDSGPGKGNIYAIKPKSNMTLDFNGCTINCNGDAYIVPVQADNKSNITVKNLRVTGNPRYGIWFRTCSNINLQSITMNLRGGLGIRVDDSKGGWSRNLTANNINITGASNHAFETYGVDGINIGTVNATDIGYCGLMLNKSRNATVGTVNGVRCCPGGGYAAFRCANDNGPNIRVSKVYARGCGRGFFSVSGSRDCIINSVDIADCTDIGIWIQDSYDTHVRSGTVARCDDCWAITGGSGNSVNVSCR